jgi:hypothetical protein
MIWRRQLPSKPAKLRLVYCCQRLGLTQITYSSITWQRAAQKTRHVLSGSPLIASHLGQRLLTFLYIAEQPEPKN